MIDITWLFWGAWSHDEFSHNHASCCANCWFRFAWLVKPPFILPTRNSLEVLHVVREMSRIFPGKFPSQPLPAAVPRATRRRGFRLVLHACLAQASVMSRTPKAVEFRSEGRGSVCPITARSLSSAGFGGAKPRKIATTVAFILTPLHLVSSPGRVMDSVFFLRPAFSGGRLSRFLELNSCIRGRLKTASSCWLWLDRLMRASEMRLRCV